MSVEEGFIGPPGSRTWYRIVGERSGAVPLLMVHGGPGSPWPDRLEAVERWARDRPVVLYHQLGCGRSDDPADPSRWTIDAFADEVAAVRDHLGLERVHVYGWSWGGMLAVSYALRTPEGLCSLVLASPVINVPLWVREGHLLRDELPPETVRALRRYEDAYRHRVPRRGRPRRGRTSAQLERGAAVMRRVFPILESAPAQRVALAASRLPPLRRPSHRVLGIQFARRYALRADPMPPDIFTMFAGVNRRLYRAMWGPAEYISTGTLKDVDLTPRLSELDVPVLVTSGAYDEATPAQMQDVVDHLRHGRWVVFERSAHAPILEEPAAYAEAVSDFLAEVDASQ